ncbi:MAG: GGDEF domain-containing protein [Pseudohongiellaceae bacterium]
MEKLLVTEYKRYQRYGLKFSMLLVSIDGYDKIRRQHGQDSGDAIFRAVAEVFQKSLRQPDIPAQWDREEFLILLPHTGKESARLVAQRLCKQISQHQFYLDGTPEKATATIAVREATEEDLSTSLQKLEVLLYKASRQQGNQVVSE